jgi:tetratricopeptide (TPR) repeat protein
MSVYQRIIGWELPCTVLDLLGIQPALLEPAEHEQLQRRAELGQADAHTLYRLGSSHLAAGKLGLARQDLNAALHQNSHLTAARLMLAGVCDLLAQHDQAAIHLEEILAAGDSRRSPDSVPCSAYRLLCALGFCLERQGQWDQAKARYVMALSTPAADLFAPHRLTAIHLAHGELGEAASCLKQILRQQPQDQTARVCLGHLLQRTDRREEAVWEYEQALCLEPDTWELPLELARKLQLMESTEEAIGVLQLLIGAQPHFPDLRMRLGNLYSGRGDEDLARAEYHKALALHPEYLDAHIALARHELRAGCFDQAVDHFQLAIAINNQHVEACVGLALALRPAGRRGRVAEMLDSAGRIANNSAVLMAQLAILQSDQLPAGDIAAGNELQPDWIVEQVQRDEVLLARHPHWADLRLRQAMLMRLVAWDDQAKTHLRRLVQEDPHCSPAWLQLGLLLAHRGRTRKAVQMLENFLHLDADSGPLSYQLALICCAPTEFDLAMECLELSAPIPADVQRRIWAAIEPMHLTGLDRRTGSDSRIGLRVGNSMEL